MTENKKRVAILISDIRGFTAISEKYADIAVVKLLNRYFDVMNKIIIKQYGGYIDKYMGDSILAVFGIHDESTPAQRAIECACDMQIAMDTINQHNEFLGFEHIYMGIGINYADVIVAEMGNELYSELTIIGDSVNLTSRIEAFSLRGQILLSDKTLLHVRNHIEIGDIQHVYVKGKKEPVSFSHLLSCNFKESKTVPQRDVRKSMRVEVELMFSYQQLKDKVVLDEHYEARSIDISYNGLLAEVYQPLELFSEVKIRLILNTKHCSEVYAKVLRVRSDNEQKMYAHLEFISLDFETKKSLQIFIDNLIAT